MARKKVSRAARMLEVFGREVTDADDLAEVLCCLQHWADANRISYSLAEAGRYRVYQGDMAGESAEPLGFAHSSTYSGWDRIHDDNKAEGRPVGNQWSDAGVDYSNGYKVHR
jgi:hypothetical protein